MFLYYINVPLNRLGIQEFENYQEGMPNVRTFKLSEIDNLDDWNSFTNCLDGISTLIIYDFKLYTENPIISNYRIATLQAYIYHLKNSVQNLQIFLKETLPVNSAA